MACEEQRNRMAKLEQEMTKATSEESKSTLQQQIMKEMAILEEREFCVFSLSVSHVAQWKHQSITFQSSSMD